MKRMNGTSVHEPAIPIKGGLTMFKASRYVFLLLIIMLLPTVLACSSSSSGESAGKTASATVSIDLKTASQDGQHSPFLGTIDDITSITVDVLQGSTPLITGQQLVNNNGVWSGVLPNLPIGPPLTFVGHAYNASAVQIFTGTTIQALTGQNDVVNILLAPITNGVTQTFPKITNILLPEQILTSNTVTISIFVSAGFNEALTYMATAAPAGGSFNPSNGTINLSGTTATLVLSYTAPSTAGTYTHSIRVTNSQSNWVETNFSTVITGTASPSVIMKFAPMITAIGAMRSGSDVAFTAEVSDTGPLSALTYSWGFDGGLSFDDNTTNPAVLQGYDETKSGNLTLTVTNGEGAATTVSYYIAPGLLPDTVVVTQGAPWARTMTAGSSDSYFKSVSVASDGSVFAAGSIAGPGVYDFGNGVTVEGLYDINNIVLVKYNSSGVAQWAQTMSVASGSSFFNSVSVASDGSVYAAGSINGTDYYYFGGVSAAGPYAGNNIVLVKYDSSGVAQWAQSVTAGDGESLFNSVSVAPDGSVYAAGYIYGNASYNFGNSVIVMGASMQSNIVLVKYNSSGMAQWARTMAAGVNFAGENPSLFRGVSVASDGSVYAAGTFFGGDFGNGVTVQGTSTDNCVLVKYNSDGEAMWAQTVAASSFPSDFNSVSAASDGSVYAAGIIENTYTYDFGNNVTATGTNGGGNIILVKYSSSGAAQWARTVTAGGSFSIFNGVSVASDGSVYAAGLISGTGTYDFGNNVTAAGTYNGDNIVLVKYSSVGTAQLARTVTEGSGASLFNTVCAASDNSVYAAGIISGAGTYDFGDNVIAHGSYAGSNIVLVKYY